jgi:hypothetical protein
MPRYANKIDASQPGIVNGLRKIGASVESLAKIKGGCPDILVGFNGYNYLLEIKTPNSAHSKSKPGLKGNGSKTKSTQIEWYRCWRGRVDVIETLEEAVSIVTGRGKPITVIQF